MRADRCAACASHGASVRSCWIAGPCDGVVHIVFTTLEGLRFALVVERSMVRRRMANVVLRPRKRLESGDQNQSSSNCRAS